MPRCPVYTGYVASEVGGFVMSVKGKEISELSIDNLYLISPTFFSTMSKS